MLSKTVAQYIIRKISRSLSYDINLMNDQAIIIASTDADRVGSYHQGAKYVIDNKQMIEISHKTILNNVKEGVNLPIELYGNIVGVIGITGKLEEVRKYGLIIKEMTEILIMNTVYVENTVLDIKRMNKIVGDLLNSEQSIILSKSERETINEVLKDYYCAVVFNLKVDVSPPNQTTIHHYLKKNFDSNNLIASISEQQVILIISENTFESFLYTMRSFPDIECYNVGVGHFINKEEKLEASYKLAMFLSTQSSKLNKPQDITDQYLIETANSTATNLLIKKVFGGIAHQDIEKIIELVFHYIDYNSKINELADKLYIHKNTLQYRLNKITKVTGYNPRNLNDLYYLILASKLYRNEYEK